MTSMVCYKKMLHAACIAKWLSKHNRCVYCRKEVIEIFVDGHTIPFGVNSVVSTISSTMSGLLILLSEAEGEPMKVEDTFERPCERI